jgi:hypothetical protein
MGRRAHPLNRYVTFSLYLFLLLIPTIVRVTRVFLVPPSMRTPSTHAEHGKTPMKVSFHVPRCFFALQHTPSTKRHHRWCLFMFGAVPSPYHKRRTRKDTFIGVFSFSALFLRPAAQAEHETTSVVSRSASTDAEHRKMPVLASCCVRCPLHPKTHAEPEKPPTRVSFRVRRLFFYSTTHAEYDNTPSLVLFRARILSAPLDLSLFIIKYLLYII